MELGAKKLLPSLDRPGSADVLAMMGRAEDSRTPVFKKLAHELGRGISGGDGSDLFVSHMLPEVH